MRTGIVGILTGTGIVVGFFLAACALLMTGLGVYRAWNEGVGAGLELVLHAWPFWLGLIIFLASGWFGFVRKRNGASPVHARASD